MYVNGSERVFLHPFNSELFVNAGFSGRAAGEFHEFAVKRLTRNDAATVCGMELGFLPPLRRSGSWKRRQEVA
jgi:hypothetical protein